MAMPDLRPLQELFPGRFDTPEILKALARASRQLAELKGVAASIPHQGILINTLGLQEAKDSSAIENIVTTHDELFRSGSIEDATGTPATKEVAGYRDALWVGFRSVRADGLLTNRHILAIQAALEGNAAGFRKVAGTALKDGSGRIVYTPPSPDRIAELMGDLERVVNDDSLLDLDPLITMALIHHQFESIHPFYDGNGRTGRIINVLYLVRRGLLDVPVLYLSRYIVRTKSRYYALLQAVRDEDAWEEWVLYMLTALEETARQGITTIHEIRTLFFQMKHRIRSEFRFYSQDLLNNLFNHPYTKIEFLRSDLGVSRITAARYLDQLVDGGFLTKRKVGRTNYYINDALYRILTGASMTEGES